MSAVRRSAVIGTVFALGGVAIATGVNATNEPPPNVVDLVIEISGPDGVDRNGRDYDLLREALVATGLADVVATTDDITVFAPNDWAFVNLARDLGYADWDEAGALAFLIEATGFESADEPGILADLLAYHVLPTVERRGMLDGAGPLATLLGETIEVVNLGDVVDADTNDPDARIIVPFNVEASNGVVHTVDKVLRPIDLEPIPGLSPTIVEAVIEASGAEGLDTNGRDYDLLREALVATGLDDTLDTADGVTVFAPNDWAFVNLARDLGYSGWDEAEALSLLIEATGFESADQPGILADVLAYHVLPDELRRATLDGAGPIATLLGATVEVVNGGDVIDGDPNAADARIIVPLNLEVANGTIHTVDKVLRPIDLGT